MSSCNCGCSTCGSQSQPYNPCQCLDEITSGVPVVMDENCNLRALSSNGGILVTDSNGVSRSTDGSSREGLIELSPEDVPALDALFGVSGGKMFSIGKEAPEGSLIMRKGGRWIVALADTAKKTYDPANIRQGTGQLAAFICGAGGTVELGTLGGCKDSYIYIDSEGHQICKTVPQLIEDIGFDLCADAPQASDTFSPSFFLTCEEGVIVKAPMAAPVNPYNLLPKWICAFSYTIGFGPYVPAGKFEVTTIVTGSTFNYSINLDVTKITGYTPDAKVVIIHFHVRLRGNNNGTDLGFYVNENAIVQVGTAPEMVADLDNDSASAMFTIPENKIIKVTLGRSQWNAGGSSIFFGLAYVTGFLN